MIELLARERTVTAYIHRHFYFRPRVGLLRSDAVVRGERP